MLDASLEARRKRFAELSAATPEGVQRRVRLQKAVEGTAHEFHGVEVEMNQRYASVDVYPADEGPRPRPPEAPRARCLSTRSRPSRHQAAACVAEYARVREEVLSD